MAETNLGLVKTGQPCEIQLDALPDSRFRGVVHAIVPTVDRSKATILVKVRFLDKDPRILPEMRAKVAFSFEATEGRRAETPHRGESVCSGEQGAAGTLFSSSRETGLLRERSRWDSPWAT